MQSVYRRLSVAADVAPVHQIRSELHQPAQSRCIRRDSGSNAMLQRSFQCSGLTSHESHRAFDDSVGLALPLVVSLTLSGFLLGKLVQFPLPTTTNDLSVTKQIELLKAIF